MLSNYRFKLVCLFLHKNMQRSHRESRPLQMNAACKYNFYLQIELLCTQVRLDGR